MDPRFNSSPFTKPVPVSAFSPPPEASHIHSQPSTLLWPDSQTSASLDSPSEHLETNHPTSTRLQALSP